uniref:SAP domain-containing protein n=1 Tax=Chromera velia CCMP2878 TaxID=1169474 RepID=A0A0G4FN97_9ALVE|eukprot:Cvel_17894.t1-p1 / transcript=Cvel_17894.t1 / gene=Cvel_17894 / organism=Chromera_velia_CCMP2878 / gene_product=hypothetical protein / transcript_product=hypothetical protein / location=Cvel_scaffold1452:25151-28190(-) / protein_length=679 / sequence_SO=supercontig / SO=protein_coding / is_pseudo=false
MMPPTKKQRTSEEQDEAREEKEESCPSPGDEERESESDGEETETHPHTSAVLAELMKVLQSSEKDGGAFCCSGFVPLPQEGMKIEVAEENDKNQIVTVSMEKGVESRRLPDSFLEKCCVPAAFGKGNRTLVDETVRKAFAVSAQNIGKIEGFQIETSGILEKVREDLLPDFDGDITAELHKLNVYTEDGFFTEHRDTPRDETMFGTVVVCLPFQFQGGELSVWNAPASAAGGTSEPKKHRFDWAKGGSTGNGQGQKEGNRGFGVQWAAFFGDCLHEIGKVTSGQRVTLAYTLRRHPSCSTSAGCSSRSSPVSSSDKGKEEEKGKKDGLDSLTVAKLKEKCREKGLAVSGSKAQLLSRLRDPCTAPCSRTAAQPQPLPKVLYPKTTATVMGTKVFKFLQKALRDPQFLNFEGGMQHASVKCRDMSLKGADVLLYVAACRVGLLPRVITILTDDNAMEEDRNPLVLQKNLTLQEARTELSSLEIIDDSCIDRGCDFDDLDVPSKDLREDAPYKDVKRAKEIERGITRPVLQCCTVAGGCSFGNEASTSTFYTQQAILLKVPKYADRTDAMTGRGGRGLVDASAFADAEKGHPGPEEEKHAKKALSEFERKAPLGTLDELKGFAESLGVSSKGGAREIRSRCQKAVQKRYFRGMEDDMMDDEYGMGMGMGMGYGPADDCVIQ